jgi:hypothetical protein
MWVMEPVIVTPTISTPSPRAARNAWDAPVICPPPPQR